MQEYQIYLQDPEIFQQWKSVNKREFTTDDLICELHFVENDIERFYVTQLPDGSINKIEGGRVKLREGAVSTKSFCFNIHQKKTAYKCRQICKKGQN